ncbi:MAG: helix-turn-helix domain-containing protein, partial [Actinobacteria bacterium]|nr:helix-turn-helix domain-containing protein [Actinomycetota bacterium]
MSERRRKRRLEPTHNWELLVPLFEWPEQQNYEAIRPLVLFGESVGERAEQTGLSERTLYRRVNRFEAEGMESLFETGSAKRRRLPPAMRRLIVDLKAEYPRFNLSEIANIVYIRFGREPELRTVGRVLDEEPTPLKMLKRFEPYHEAPEAKKRRRSAIVQLHSEGWSVKAIAGYLKTSKPTVYRALRKWIEEGVEGLDDKIRGQKGGVRKVDLRAIEAVRRLQQNPNLGEFRVHAALAQIGIHLSPRTCGRILTLNRKLYGLEKPQRAGRREKKKEMPFKAKRRHQYWTADVRYIDHRLGGKVYVISILENHSRVILSSAISRSQDTSSYLSVLYQAIAQYGSPEAVVTDGGGIFRATQALSICKALNIAKEEIDRGQSWQSYIETTFNIQRRMADFHFVRAQNWSELVAAHDRWVQDYSEQSHWAHRERTDGRRSPQEVLGWVTGVRYREEDLERAFFSSRFSRKLDWAGYATF